MEIDGRNKKEILQDTVLSLWNWFWDKNDVQKGLILFLMGSILIEILGTSTVGFSFLVGSFTVFAFGAAGILICVGLALIFEG